MAIRKLPQLFEEIPVPIVWIDHKKQEIVGGNKALCSLFGYTQKQIRARAITDIFNVDRSQLKKKEFESYGTSKPGKKISFKAHRKIVREKGESYELLFLSPAGSVGSDELMANPTSASSLQRIMDGLHEIYLITEKDLRVEFANSAALKNLAYSPKEIASLKVSDLFTFPDEMALLALLNSLRSGKNDHLNLQLKFARKDGSHYDADVAIQFVRSEHLFLFIVSDISAKLVTEKKLLDTIREKDTLIKEIHHRVKNNLQLISSILYLKLVSLNHSEMRSFLEDTRQKIRSIALIHERLLQTEKLDKVDIADYLGKLLHDLQITYHKPDLDLQVDRQVEQKSINLDTAIICGLIVNELVTNAIKHAFHSRSHGRISVHFKEDPDGTFSLSVADDGSSLPETISPGNTTSFGMQLIDVFVKQLSGTVEIIREKGTKFQLHFPV